MELKAIALIVVGVLSISIGVLSIAGVNLQLVDTTQPTFLYTYPQADNVYGATAINELVAYVQDVESQISQVYYVDTQNCIQPVLLNPALHKDIKHPLTIFFHGLACRFPDVDNDTKVTIVDKNIISSHYDETVGPDCIYDVVPDGIIDGIDISFVSKYVGTAVFRSTLSTTYPVGVNVTFTFVAINSVNLISEYSGRFQVSEYKYLSGTWYINNVAVNGPSIMSLEGRQVLIAFNCTDKTIPEESIVVKATVNGITYKLTKTTAYFWQSNIDLKPGNNEIKLLAYTAEYINQITVIVTTPPEVLTSGYIMIAIGAACIVTGVVFEIKAKKVYTTW